MFQRMKAGTMGRGRSRQGGFTLVEMSVALAAAGLLFAAVMTGQELIDQTKATKLLNDVKSVEMQIQQYAQLKGRMPGDCNADGIIDFAADATSRLDTDNTTRALKYGYATTVPTPAGTAATAATFDEGCVLQDSTNNTTSTTLAVSTTEANTVINDLKLAGVISDSVPNRKFAKLVHEDFMFVGKITDKGGSSAADANYNAIVIHNVPQWMARRMATAINGQDAVANRSRVRLLERSGSDGTYNGLWNTTASGTTGNSRDAMVTVVYFFDRIPATS
ncbi:MAG: prepilin-type N-terminal cleavage/methylation domain-containing protein [Pseudomonadota bacterium]